MNILEFRYKSGRGFELIFKDKKGRNFFFVPDTKFYCCDTFNFVDVGLKIFDPLAFVLTRILLFKRNKNNRGAWEPVDLDANVCCFLTSGFIPFTNEHYVVIEDLSGEITTGPYPLAVFDIDGLFLGYASTSTNFISIWNASSVNTTIGQISSIGNDFIFLLTPA
jgi:hypothetical protein